MVYNEWQVGFQIAGVFVPDSDIQLTPKILIKRSHGEELIYDLLLPVHQVLVSVSEDEFKKSDYDLKKFGTNKFAEESQIGVAERHLINAMSLYSIKTGHETMILRKGAALNLTALKMKGFNDISPGVQYRKIHLNEDNKVLLQEKTNAFIKAFPKYEEILQKTHSFIGLAARYYWMAKNAYQEHAAFLNYVISLEVLLAKKKDRDSDPLKHRAALLLGGNDKEELDHYSKFGKVYCLRNDIIHDGDDTIDYDLLNYLEDVIPILLESMITLSQKLPENANKNKASICKALDEALTNDINRKQIREFTASYS